MIQLLRDGAEETNVVELKSATRQKIQQEIKQFISKQNIKPAQLAKKLNVNRSVVFKWMNTEGGQNLTLNTLIDLENIGIPVLSALRNLDQKKVFIDSQNTIPNNSNQKLQMERITENDINHTSQEGRGKSQPFFDRRSNQTPFFQIGTGDFLTLGS